MTTQPIQRGDWVTIAPDGAIAALVVYVNNAGKASMIRTKMDEDGVIMNHGFVSSLRIADRSMAIRPDLPELIAGLS